MVLIARVTPSPTFCSGHHCFLPAISDVILRYTNGNQATASPRCLCNVYVAVMQSIFLLQTIE